jgi:hypothetical protein
MGGGVALCLGRLKVATGFEGRRAVRLLLEYIAVVSLGVDSGCYSCWCSGGKQKVHLRETLAHVIILYMRAHHIGFSALMR